MNPYPWLHFYLKKCTINATEILKPKPYKSTVKIMPAYVAVIADCRFLMFVLLLLPMIIFPHTFWWIPNHTWTHTLTSTHLLDLKPVSCYLSCSPDLHHFLFTAQSFAVLFLSSLLFLLCGKQMKNHGLREVSVCWWKRTICARGRFCNSFAVEHVL